MSALNAVPGPRLGTPSPFPPDPIRLAESFVATLAGLERQARRSGRSVPDTAEQELVASSFWQLMDFFREWETSQERSSDELRLTRARVRDVLNPTMLRSTIWNRSLIKPHGYAGDYATLELMYELESARGDDPTQPFLVNCLDALFRTVHSVQAVWHRRHWYADLVESCLLQSSEELRVLDVACGGARYLHDVATRQADPARLNVALVDQDPAALAFAGKRLRDCGAQVTALCGRVRDVDSLLGADVRYDLLFSAGLMDYLDHDDAAALLRTMIQRAAPGAAVAVCNFSPLDLSRVVKDWVSDWLLIYRDASALSRCFPAGTNPATHVSPDGGLVYAVAHV